MQPDVTTLYHWYDTSLGQTAAEDISACFHRVWSPLSGERVLVIGYGAPYMSLWPKAHLFWGMPAAMGGYPWPEEGPCRSLLVHGHALPFADQTFDRVVLLHALEFSPHPEALLAECYRVMYPAGQLAVVVPNRLGLWARKEGSPFAQGLPYSSLALRRLLMQKGFRLKSLNGCLFMAPVVRRRQTFFMFLLEHFMRLCTPAMSGALLAVASKDVLGGRVIRAQETRLGLLDVVRPQPVVPFSSCRDVRG